MEFVKSLVYEFAEMLDSILYSFPFTLFQFIGAVATVILFIIWVRMLSDTGIVKTRIAQFREMAATSSVPKKKLFGQWSRVLEKIGSQEESDWKLAIIEADSIMDELIKALGYRGDTMGERMTKIKPGQFPHLDDAWRVHKVRNFIAHDPSYKIGRETALRAIKIYELIFSEFNMIK
ncbi:MAG: hypothetical protein WD712_01580 [Candidatus Spechtbacterales bacterium]